MIAVLSSSAADMASSNSTFAFADEVEAKLRRREIYRSADSFAEKIGIHKEFERERASRLLVSMVQLVKDRMAGARGQRYADHKRWLTTCAKTLDACQIEERGWIERHVYRLPQQRSRKEEVYHSRQSLPEDVRHQTNPDLPTSHFVESGRNEDDTLLYSTTTPVPGTEGMDIGSDPEVELGSPSPVKPKPSPPVALISDATPVSNAAPGFNPVVAVSSPERTVGPSIASSVPTEGAVGPSPALVKQKESTLERTVGPSATSANGKERTVGPSKRKFDTPRPRTSRSSTHSSGPGNSTAAKERSVERRSKRIRGEQLEDLRIKITSSRSLRDNVPSVRAKTTRSRCERRQRFCTVPGCKVDAHLMFPKIHAFEFHIPGIFDLRLPAEEPYIVMRRIQALQQATTWLLGRPGSLQELVDYVAMQRCLHDAVFTSSQVQAMKAVGLKLGLTLPRDLSVNPPNNVAVLIHWRILNLIAALLPEEDRLRWIRLFPESSDQQLQEERDVVPEIVPEQDPVYPKAVDSHFHLDRLQNVAGWRYLPVREALDSSEVEESRRVTLEAVVANFCDPETYPSDQTIAEFPPEIILTAGIHPKHARRSRNYVHNAVSGLERLLRNSRVVGVGEIGLDHSINDKDWHTQNALLRRVLPLIEPRHVVVVHCRGMDGDDGLEAYALLRSLFKSLPSTQKIHLHSFMGTTLIVRTWLQAFPMTWFSFNRSVRHFDAEQIEALKALDEEKLLLETDAPYFKRGAQDPYSMPNQLFDVADLVAGHRGVDVNHILDVTRVNALTLYQGK